MHGGKKKKNLTKAITLVKLTRCIQVQTEDYVFILYKPHFRPAGERKEERS
jgi:hypothetical protein